jgi:putative NADH-flavin reductase
VVERALEVGHVVTAFTRNPAAVQRHHDRLQTASGDALDAAAVLRAVEGRDAVISVYGVRFDPLHKITISRQAPATSSSRWNTTVYGATLA